MNLYTHISALIIGAVIAFLCLRGCEEKPKPEMKIITHDSLVVIHDTIFKGEGKGKLKYTYSGVLRDTVIRNDSVFITVRDSTQFTAVLDTIQNRDTLHLEYSYPASLFRYRLSRQPDSIILKNRETIITTYIDSPWYDQSRYSVPIAVLVMLGLFGVVR